MIGERLLWGSWVKRYVHFALPCFWYTFCAGTRARENTSAILERRSAISLHSAGAILVPPRFLLRAWWVEENSSQAAPFCLLTDSWHKFSKRRYLCSWGEFNSNLGGQYRAKQRQSFYLIFLPWTTATLTPRHVISFAPTRVNLLTRDPRVSRCVLVSSQRGPGRKKSGDCLYIQENTQPSKKAKVQSFCNQWSWLYISPDSGARLPWDEFNFKSKAMFNWSCQIRLLLSCWWIC